MIINLLALAAICAANASLRSSDSSTVFIQLDSKPMGNALISLVQLHLSAGAPLDDLVGLLEQIQEELEEQQADDDQASALENTTCSTNLGTYAGLLEDAQDQIQSSSDNLNNTLLPELANTQSQIQSAEDDLDTLQSELEAATEQRSDDHDAWEHNDEDFSDAIAACEEAIELMSQLQSNQTAEFVQLGLRNLEKRMSRGMNPTSRMLFGMAVTSLAQVAISDDQDDQALVSNIIALIQEIEASLEQSQENAAEAEESAADAFDTYNDTLTGEIETTSDRLDQLESTESDLEDEISAEQGNIEAAQEKQGIYSSLLEQQQEQCDAWAATYTANTATRNGELEILEQVIEIVNDRIVTMDSYLNNRVNVYSS